VLGQNDVSIFNRTLPWDHAAGALFLNEAGGRAARLDGSEYRVDDWNRTGMIGAATPKLWDQLASLVAMNS
jgi:fructose-1,6-bisphosphatase/inositol monophosphatase family enzyme